MKISWNCHKNQSRCIRAMKNLSQIVSKFKKNESGFKSESRIFWVSVIIKEKSLTNHASEWKKLSKNSSSDKSFVKNPEKIPNNQLTRTWSKPEKCNELALSLHSLCSLWTGPQQVTADTTIIIIEKTKMT